MAWVGCHVDAYEQAKWFGDEMALKGDFRRVDFANATSGPLFMLRHLGAGLPLRAARRAGPGVPRRRAPGRRIDAREPLARLGRPDGAGRPRPRVRDTVEQSFERWDGRGAPKGLEGDEILLTARLVNLADVVEVFHRAGRRAGGRVGRAGASRHAV